MSRFEIISFLEKYKQYPCLWDKKHPDFKSRQKRDIAEESLWPESGLSSIKELRTKIRTIRCTYNQEVAKIKKSCKNAIGTSDIYKPKLTWFSYADSFLKTNYEEDDVDLDTYLTLVYQNGNTTAETQILTSEVSEDASIGKESVEVTETQSATPINKACTSAKPHLPKSPRLSDMLTSSKRRFQIKKPKLDTALPEAVIALKVVSSQQPVSEFAFFGQYVANQLSQLPLEDALILQEDIQRIITRARIHAIQSSSSSSNTINTA